MLKKIWISWEHQIRNKSMSTFLNANLYVYEYKGNAAIRYFICMFKTLKIIHKIRPNIVFAPNPSIVLTFYLLLLRCVYHFKFVSDAHYAGIVAATGIVAAKGVKIFQTALNLCNRWADCVVVTTEGHRQFVEKIGGKGLICEDPLPDISKYSEKEILYGKSVLFICSFDIDEPFRQVFNTGKKLSRLGYKIYVSGNYQKAKIDPIDYKEISFLGYVSEEVFYSYLYKSNIILDLTENENCLLCGCYEAMVAERPLVTSDSMALRRYFTRGTIFTSHDEDSIVNSIILAYENREKLKDSISEWKYTVNLKLRNNIKTIKNFLGIVD